MGKIIRQKIEYAGAQNVKEGNGIDITGNTVSVNDEIAITSGTAGGVRLFATGVPSLGEHYIQLSTGSDIRNGEMKDKDVAINMCAGTKQNIIAGYKWNAESTAANKWENLFYLDCEDKKKLINLYLH